MSVKAIYNEIASQYANADCFGGISKSHNCAISQIKDLDIDRKPHCKILDLGVGDGAFLRKISRYFPMAELTGIDVSAEMLKQAANGFALTTIEASAAEASQYLPTHSQDLVLAHFINAYVPMHVLFKQAQMMTRANGYFSVITTTYESFPVTQQHLANFIAKESILSSIVGHYYKSVVKNTTVATGQDELLQSIRDHKFEIIDHQRIQIPISFNNIDELAFFGIEGAWFLNCLSFGGLPRNFLLQRIKSLFNKISTFPYEDIHYIDVVLAKK